MSKKSMVIESIKVVGGKLNKAGHYEMTKKQFEKLDAELGNQTADYAFCNNKIDDSLKAVYDGKKKNKYAIIKLVEAKKVTKKESTKKVQKSKHEDNKKIVKLNGLVSGKRIQRTAYVDDYKTLTEKAIEEFAKEFGFEYVRSYTMFGKDKMVTKTVSKNIA